MSRAQGINTNFNTVIGLMISNGLVGLASALYSQYQGFADVNAGRGAIVIGLAAVIIGTVLFEKIFHNFALKLFLSVAIGAVIYYAVLQIVIWLGLDTNYLKAVICTCGCFLPCSSLLEEEIFYKTSKERSQNQCLKLIIFTKHLIREPLTKKTALNGTTLTLNEGDFVTVIGGNGAGKSTLLNAIAGVFLVDEGSISIDDVDVTRMSEHRRASFLGRVFQDPMMELLLPWESMRILPSLPVVAKAEVLEAVLLRQKEHITKNC